MPNKIEILKSTLQDTLKGLEGYSLISTDKLTQLVDNSDLLECLRSVGVEKWEKYDEAKEMFYDED